MSKLKNAKQTKKPNHVLKIVVAIGVVAIVAIGVVLFTKGNDTEKVAQNEGAKSVAANASPTGEPAATDKGITINKSEVTDKASFIPYQVGDTKMEVIAVKASDGTIRTALNTCQVCNNSGRGYYVQEGDELVCQNCGNRFKIDQVEKQKNGCNPVPLIDKYKTETDSTITIADELLQQAVPLFVKWKK